MLIIVAFNNGWPTVINKLKIANAAEIYGLRSRMVEIVFADTELGEFKGFLVFQLNSFNLQSFI